VSGAALAVLLGTGLEEGIKIAVVSGAGLIVLGLAVAAAPLIQIAVVRTNLGNDWSGLQPRAVLETFGKVWLQAYLGTLLWMGVAIAMVLGGVLACLVGVYFVQAFLLAGMGVFWVDLYRLAVERGATPVLSQHAPITDVARVFE
jgi:hypothetical protein